MPMSPPPRRKSVDSTDATDSTIDPNATITRCLSVRRPWAPLIVNGYKPLENRSWPTDFRGRIAIHASGKFDGQAYERHLDSQPAFCTRKQARLFREYMRGENGPPSDVLADSPVTTGCIIGTVELVDVIDVLADDFQLADLAFPTEGFNTPCSCWWANAQFAWIFANPVAFTHPITCKGKLNLWHLGELTAAVNRENDRCLEAVGWTRD
jgi:hypothetical protein